MDAEEPESVAEIATEARTLIDAFDGVPWPQMDALFYVHSYDEFRLVLERLLDAIQRESPGGRDTS